MKYKTNMKKEKKIYESPQLTVVEFRVERGFAESSESVWAAQQAVQTFVDQQMIMAQANDGTDGNLVGGYMSGHEDHSGDGAGGGGWQYENGGWF